MKSSQRINYEQVNERLHSVSSRSPTLQSAIAANVGLGLLYVLVLALLWLPGPQQEILERVVSLVPTEIYFFGFLGALVYIFSTLRTLVDIEKLFPAGTSDEESSRTGVQESGSDDPSAQDGLSPFLRELFSQLPQAMSLFSYFLFYLVTATLLAGGSYLVFAAFYTDLGASGTDSSSVLLALAFLTGLFIDPILRMLERTVRRVAGEVPEEKRSLIIAATEAEIYRNELEALRNDE